MGTMRSREKVREILARNKGELRARFGVRRIGIFGSYARGEQTPSSDVDILVEFERPMGWEIVDLHRYLEEILGLEVDLVTVGALRRKPYLWQIIQKDLINA